MWKTIICEVDFEDNPSQVVWSGQRLRGNVYIKLGQQKLIRGIYIQLLGRGYAHWSEGKGGHRKEFIGKENYLNVQQYLIGGTSGEIQLAPGDHHYPFEFQLPSELPTSCEGEHGFIRYDANIVMKDIYAAVSDKEFELPFSVVKAINLNADPKFREPVIVKQDKVFISCYLFCCVDSAPLELIGRAPVGGYVPGQTINFEFIISNKSSEIVSSCTVQLIRQITYHTHNSSLERKQETMILTEEETRGCPATRDDVINVNIKVPAVPPTDETTSNIIKVRYFCRVIGSVSCHTNPVLMVPITIGTYPLLDVPGLGPPQTLSSLPTRSSIQPSNGDVSQATDSTTPNTPSQEQNGIAPSPSAPIQFPNDEPPTYEEALQSRKKPVPDFVPKYPMYKRQTSYSH